MALLRNSAPDDGARPAAEAPRPAALLSIALRAGATPEERRQAALDLATEPDAATVLVDALGAEPAPRVREAIVTTLIVIRSDAAAAGLAGFLNSEDPELRNLAIEALREMGEVAESQIDRLLASSDPDVRIFAVNVLETLGYRRAADRDRLHIVLEQDSEVNVGLAAVEALSQIGSPNDVTALRVFAARFPDHPFVGFAVDLVCKQILPGGGA